MGEFDPILLTSPSALAPALAVEVLPHGFTIHRLLVQVDGKTHDIVIGPEAPEGHVTQKYTNSIVGRYANRIPVGTHHLERNGFKKDLTTIPNESPQVSLHGGPDGFDARPWVPLAADEKPALFTAAEIAELSSIPKSSLAVFRLVSPAGDQGFPGTLLTEALIALVDPAASPQINDPSVEYDLGSVVLVYRAKVEDTNTVTPVNLTQHWGFNLDASLQDGPDSLSIKNHRLSIKASGIAELDSHALGTGNYISVAQLPAHNHADKIIADHFPTKGYDDYYLFKDDVLSNVPSRIPASQLTDDANYLTELLRPLGRESAPSTLIALSSEKSGLKLQFGSNQHGAMFYSNAMSNPANGARKKIHGGSGIPGDGAAYGPSTAAFIEFHHPLAAFLYSENKDKEDTLVTSEEIYHNFVRLDVKFKRP